MASVGQTVLFAMNPVTIAGELAICVMSRG